MVVGGRGWVVGGRGWAWVGVGGRGWAWVGMGGGRRGWVWVVSGWAWVGVFGHWRAPVAKSLLVHAESDTRWVEKHLGFLGLARPSCSSSGFLSGKA